MLTQTPPLEVRDRRVDDTAPTYSLTQSLRAVTESDGLLIKEIDGRWR